MDTSEKLREYLESDENKLVIETNAQILTLKEIVEELYCTSKGYSPEQYKALYRDMLEKNKQYLFRREMKVVEELEQKEVQSEQHDVSFNH